MLGIGKKHPGDGKEARQHKQRKKVGVAFGGGGLKGSAHVGILKVLTEHNIPIDMVAGTSIGAAVAALYASGYDWKMLEKSKIDQHITSIFLCHKTNPHRQHRLQGLVSNIFE